MFILDEKPLALDMPFATNGVSYPANWLRLASVEEREAIGISEVTDEPYYDQRFYWGVDLPKDHGQLVDQWVSQTKQAAGSILSQTDWYITRFSETGLEAPQSVLDRRSEVRVLSNEKEAFLRATASTEELAGYVTSYEYSRWESPSTEEPEIIELIEEPLTNSNPVFTGGNGTNSGSSNVYSN